MKSELIRKTLAVILSIGIAMSVPTPPALAQGPGDDSPQVPPANEQGAEAVTLTMLRTLWDTTESKRASLERLREALAQTLDPEGQQAIRDEAAELEQEIRNLEGDFDALATGLDLEEFRKDLHSSTDLRQEVEALLRPLLEELKQATKTPRQIEQLRRDLARVEERRSLADRAIGRLRVLVEENRDPMLSEVLAGKLGKWEADRQQLENQRAIIDFQLTQLLESRQSLIESSGDFVSTFFRSRGLHFLMALGAFIAVFGAFRGVYYLTSHRRRGRKRSFYSRLFLAISYFLAFFGATFASLIVLYATGDWVLLGLMLIFLAGLAWAGRQVVPRFVNQGRLLLNIGPVREGERVVLDRVPFQVTTLGLLSFFENPMLTGGRLRRSLESLMEMQSRPCEDDEVWFPCRERDWIQLEDGTWGRVAYQGPEFVQVQCKGGASVTYRTGDFLGMSPKNLSRGFRVEETFGVDYRHKAISTTEIPAKMHAALADRLAGLIGAENLESLAVELKSAGSSSLDYSVLADFSGDVASSLDVLQRAVASILVDVCNEEGWVIPFTQVTVHQR